jgi:hypothetical protein
MLKDCPDMVQGRLNECQVVDEQILQKQGTEKRMHLLTSICPNTATVKGTVVVPADEAEVIGAFKADGGKDVGECKMEGEIYKVLEAETPMQSNRYNPTGG